MALPRDKPALVEIRLSTVYNKLNVVVPLVFFLAISFFRDANIT